jgi:PPOX class probable FMN-dependent enzyme
MSTLGPGAALTSHDELRALYPAMSDRAARKVIDRLDGHGRRFIELSPFCVLSTVGSDGGPDLSPRGGEPGFVRTPDEHTAVLPDRPGNYRLDNLTNAVVRPAVALLFMVPGIEETLRVYGQAEVVTLEHARRLALGVDNKGRTELRITVTSAFFHCAKAIMRSRLWDAATQVDRDVLPTMGEILKDHTGLLGPVESQDDMRRRYQPDL